MKDDRVYLVHINECINKIEQYTISGKDAFMESSYTQDAVIRNLEVIGEATKRISMDFRNQYPDIPWKQMAALRDVLIHDYMGIDVQIVWNVVAKDLPQVKMKLNSVLSKKN
ncbi:MAG: DUF86 domain-containing protein [Syntrophomonas sp.]